MLRKSEHEARKECIKTELIDRLIADPPSATQETLES
ncbi:hypothetical protein Pan189_22670 [Stratiformator vulcanicus]|uniref:Uncharacterized protein n=1 Tax=Stratiformator vulcanicus TaxID=2527980 RepID=A0A517R207_9PLAN|nr:hypothetical protein Pan189_22670 [Stratiformator vulcanicus]